MSTPAIDFSKYETAAPPQIDFSKYGNSSQAKPSVAERLGTNFLSGLGVTSNEQAKNFFVHPLDTVIKSFEAQGELAKKARDAYKRGDYMEALQHGLNYLVPFIGQQTDQAGEQLKAGDIAGGVGRTLGAAVPIVAGSPEVQATASDVASAAGATAARAIRASARGANEVLQKAPGAVGGAVGGATGAAIGHATGVPYGTVVGEEIGRNAGVAAGKVILPKVRIPGEGFGLPSRVMGGPATIPAEAETPVAAPGTAGSVTQSVAAQPSAAPQLTLDALSGGGPPRTGFYGFTDTGEGALRDILSREDNANLLKIARSRGINVTQEAALKPGAGNFRIINKIVNDFSEDELDNFRSTYIENHRTLSLTGSPIDEMGWRGKIGKEANKTLNLQTYFPDVNIPAATLKRTRSAVTAAKSGMTTLDLLNALKAKVAAKQAAQAPQ